MDAVRYIQYWLKPKSLLDAVLMVLFFAMLPLLFFGDIGTSESRLLRMIWNLGHYFLFGVFTVLVLDRVKLTTVKQFVLMVAMVLVLGFIIEAVQIFTPRDADLRDIISNVLGSLIVLFWYWKPGITIWIGRVVTTLLVMQPIAAIAYVGYWQYQAVLQFPVLSTFEHQYDRYRWRGGRLSTDVASEGKQSLKVQLNTRRYSGTGLEEMPGDWSQYNYLKFDVFNPDDEDINLTLRIHDRFHRRYRFNFDDRFNRSFTIVPGWNQLSVNLEEVRTAPSDREMDMHNVVDIGLFAISLPQPRIIYTDNWRLE